MILGFRIASFRFQVYDSLCRISGKAFKAVAFLLRVQGLVEVAKFWVLGLGFGVWSLEFCFYVLRVRIRVYGLGFRVQGFRFPRQSEGRGRLFFKRSLTD